MLQSTSTSPHNVVQGEVITQIAGLYDFIGGRLNSLPKQLNTTSADDSDSESDDNLVDESSAYSNAISRKDVVQEMLSVFDRDLLPSELGQRFPEEIPAADSELLVPGNLVATIYGLAVCDDVFFRRLRKVIGPEVCAGVYYAKQHRRAKEIMMRLDQYAQNGPSNSPRTRDVDVGQCARTLRLIVHQICEDRDSRLSKEPLGAAITSKIAEILVEILYEVVCNRNRDVYEESTWKETQDHERDHNLYTYLIGNPPKYDTAVPAGMVDDFVIDRLHEFPAHEWSHLLEHLTTIQDSIHENTSGRERASVKYAGKLEAMLRDYTNTAFEPSSSSARRRLPTLESTQERQRRRVG